MNRLEGNDNILLIGFMGVGKSAVAHRLGAMLRRQVIDTDQVIVHREGMSIPDIFGTKGETYFREKEAGLFLELSKVNNTIISCGGGAVLAKENILYMKECGTVVLLEASPETVYDRIKGCEDRPVLKNKNSVEHITHLMAERCEKYEEAADLVLQTENNTVEQVCQELMKRLTEINKNNV